MDIHGYPWISSDHGYPQISMDIHGYQWIPTEIYGYLWISMDMNGYPWISMDIHGHPWICMDINNWAPVSESGFWDFQVSRFSIREIVPFCKIFSKYMLVRYRGINNKGVLERPGAKWRVLKAISSSTLKCQFTAKC